MSLLGMIIVLIAIGLVLSIVGIGYVLLPSLVDHYREQRRLQQVWGGENDRPPPWDRPDIIEDTGPKWRKARFKTLMDRLTLVKTNDHDDYLFRQDYFRDTETGQLWRLTTEEPNMSQFQRLTPVDAIPEDD